KRAERAQDAEVVVGGRVVALVVDDEAEVASGEELGEPLLVQRAQRRDEHLRIGGCAIGAALERDRGPGRAPELLDRLPEQLLAMREHEHLLARAPRELGEDDRLARAGREAHDHPPRAGATRGDHRVDRLALIRPELEHRAEVYPATARTPRRSRS